MSNIVQINMAESQTLNVYWQDAVDLELDLHLMYVKSGQQEIQDYVNNVSKKEVDSYVKTHAEPIMAEVAMQIAKPEIDEYVNNQKTELQTIVNQTQAYAISAAGSAENALASENNSLQAANNAEQFMQNASENAKLAQSWAIGEIEDCTSGSSKYWAELSQKAYIAGALMAFAGDTPPDGWLVCDGSEINREDYTDLFAVIGTKYGSGNGSTTFNVPNYVNRTFWGGTASGTILTAGLPNITGKIDVGSGSGAVQFGVLRSSTGCFSLDNTVSCIYEDGQDASPIYRGLNFNAASSSSVYGASSTVQPPAIKTLFCIKY